MCFQGAQRFCSHLALYCDPAFSVPSSCGWHLSYGFKSLQHSRLSLMGALSMSCRLAATSVCWVSVSPPGTWQQLSWCMT